MKAYRDTITLELDEIEQRVLANFYDMVSNGILEYLQDEDVIYLLQKIANNKINLEIYDDDIPNIKISYIKSEEQQEE